MNERAALLRSIFDSPDDDVVRLVFADWLEENGEPERAALIRLQIDLAKCDRFDGEHNARSRQIWLLLRDHEKEWRTGLPAINGVIWSEFERGFVSSVILDDAARFLQYGCQIMEAAPIERIHIRHIASGTQWVERELAREPLLERVTRLDLDSCRGVGFYELAALARSAHLTRLRELNLRFLGLLTMAGEILARYADWRNMQRLVLTGNYLRDDGLAYLVRYANWPELRELQMAQNGLTLFGLAMLLDAPWQRLEFLDLTSNRLGSEGWRDILRVAPDFRPRRLHLNYCGIGDMGSMTLAELPWLSELRELRLIENEITDRGAIALAESPYLGQLKQLQLGGNPRIGSSSVGMLRERFGDGVKFH